LVILELFQFARNHFYLPDVDMILAHWLFANFQELIAETWELFAESHHLFAKLLILFAKRENSLKNSQQN
jgi:hypothetical protein